MTESRATSVPSDHHNRISHSERKIEELEEEIAELKGRLSQMALHNAELEAALLRLDQKVKTPNNQTWDYFK